MIKSKLVLATFAIGLLFSCDKKDDDSTPTKTNEQLIIGEWNYVKQSINGVTMPYSDPCHVEFEVLSFKNDKTYKQTEFENISGAGCEEGQASIGVWEIDGATVTLNGQAIQILTLNETVFSFTYTDDGETIVDNLKRKN